MDHKTIEKQHIIDRYLLGQLSPGEEESFVNHYMSCQECLDQLERSERFQRAIKHQAAGEAVAEVREPSGRLLRFLRRPSGKVLSLAALLLLTILPASLMRQEVSRLRHELDTTRRAQSNVTLATLGVERGTGSTPTQQIRLGSEPGWVILSLELELVEHDFYRTSLLDAEGREVWVSGSLAPTPADTLTVGLRSTDLAPGDYAFRVEALGSNGVSSSVSRFPFRVTIPSAGS